LAADEEESFLGDAAVTARETGQAKLRWVVPAVLGVTLLFYLFLAWALPYCPTDDFQWGMEQGVRWWRYGLLNGRYVGNLITLLMCHFEPLKVLIMGGCMFAIPFLIAVLAGRGDREKFLPIFLLANPLILIMPAIMWTELYGWVSGFGNYGVSAAVFLAFLLLVRQTYEKRDRLKLRAAVLFAAALAMGLFVETQAILFLGVTLVLGVYASVWDKPLRLPFWASFAGAVLAAAVMFSNSIVSLLVSGGTALNGLRELTFDPAAGPLAAAAGILKWYIHRLLPIALLRGPHLAVPMAIIIAAGFWNSRFRPLCLLGAVPLAAHWLIWSTNDYLTYSHTAAGCLCWALTLLALLACRSGRELKLRRVLLFFAAPLDLLPLAATTTLGHRFYFLPMLILILLAGDLAAPLLTRRAGKGLVGVVMAGFLLVLGWRYAAVAGCSLVRVQEIRRAAAEGADTLVLPSDRYGDLLWRGRNPTNPEYACYFRWFYGISDDVTLIFLPKGSYETWPDYTDQQWEERTEIPPYTGEFKSSLP